MTIEVPLTQGYAALIDEEDAGRVLVSKWTVFKTGKLVYAYRKQEGKSLLLHRFLLGAQPGDIVDHIDGNGLNNVRDNLRLVTAQQNNFNQGKGAGRSSQYKGVYWDADRGRWVAQIKHNQRVFYLGSYPCEEDAALARDAKARELFGEFARLNFPEEVLDGAAN